MIQDPPTIMILRRKAIRTFPGGERVALYRNDQLGLDFSVPYKSGDMKKTPITAVKEETQIEEAVVHKLHHIASTKTAGEVVFKNGARTKVEPKIASLIMTLHANLKPSNKKKIEDLVNKSPQGLEKVADFALTNLK